MDYCVSRTPTQVASHAQKYFLRRELTPSGRHKKRPSIHDITRASISPYSASLDRDHVRVTLQEIVRAGTDLAGASDSNDNSASSSGKSASSTCLPVLDPIFGKVFAFTVDAAAAAANSSGVDVTFGVAGAQQMQQVQRMQCAVMHPMHRPTAASMVHGAVGSWTLPGGAVVAPMTMPPGMQLQPGQYPGPMQIPPQEQLACMTPGVVPLAQQGPMQTLHPVYPSPPTLPHAPNMVPDANKPACTTGTVGSLAARRSGAQRGPTATPSSAPVNPACSGDATYSQSMAGAGWVTISAHGSSASALPPQTLSSSSRGVPRHEPRGETAFRPDAHSRVMPTPFARVASQGSLVPHTAAQQQQQQSRPHLARQLSTDRAPASNGKDRAARDLRGVKRDGGTVPHLMRRQQPRQYRHPELQPEPAATFQVSGTLSAGAHHRPGLQMPLWPADGASAGPPLNVPPYGAALTMGEVNNVRAQQVSSSRALVGTLSEPLNVGAGRSCASGFGSNDHDAWRSTVPEAQHVPGVGGEAISAKHALQPPHYPVPLSASLLRSVSASEAQLPENPFSASVPHGGASVSGGAQLLPGSGSLGMADSRGGGSTHAHSFQPFAHEAGLWSEHTGDALGTGSLEESGIVDYLLGSMPLLVDPLLDVDVHDKSSSGSAGARSGSAGERSGVAGGGVQ